jgi:hypothetical protein
MYILFLSLLTKLVKKEKNEVAALLQGYALKVKMRCFTKASFAEGNLFEKAMLSLGR